MRQCQPSSTVAQAETTPPGTFRRFLELPIEIRLMIYKELLIQNADLYGAKCPSCVECEEYRRRHFTYSNYISTQIFTTSKQIYSAAQPFLDSKNTVHLHCYLCQRSGKLKLWACPVEPDALRTEPIAHYRRHVRKVAIAYETGWDKPWGKLCDQVNELPDHWPSMEGDILVQYGNIDYISLRIGLADRYVDFVFDLVRRSCDSKTQRIHNYENILAQHRAHKNQHWHDNLEHWTLSLLEQVCDTIILSEARGALKDTVFAVQKVYWLSRFTRVVAYREIVLYLGCDKHSTSDAQIEQIIAKQERRGK